MKIQRFLIALTLANAILFLLTLGQHLYPAFAQGAPPVLRGSALQIVDTQGRVRASLNVLPAGKSPSGDPYPETVLLRLITERGRPSVKISASVRAGPLSTLTSVFLGHSILVAAAAELERAGHHCVYTSVNTPEGEKRNLKLEAKARIRDPLLK